MITGHFLENDLIKMRQNGKIEGGATFAPPSTVPLTFVPPTQNPPDISATMTLAPPIDKMKHLSHL
jgi:hypothetical protein